MPKEVSYWEMLDHFLGRNSKRGMARFETETIGIKTLIGEDRGDMLLQKFFGINWEWAD